MRTNEQPKTIQKKIKLPRPEDLDLGEREYNRREKEITDFYTKLAENARN